MWWLVSRSISLPLGGCSLGRVSPRHLVSGLKPQYVQANSGRHFSVRPRTHFTSPLYSSKQTHLSSIISEDVRSLQRLSVLHSSVRHNSGLDGPEARLSGAPKQEMIARQMANDNPFDNYTFKPDAGTGLFEGMPVLIPSAEESRVIGCCCEDDYQDIVWFTLHKGKVQKCDCGNYFKLIDHDPLDPNVKPKYGEGFGSGLGSMYY